jgi:hypothetical protein
MTRCRIVCGDGQSDLAEDRAAPDDGDCQHVWPPKRADEAMRRRTNRTAKQSPNAAAGCGSSSLRAVLTLRCKGFDTQIYVAH